MIRVWKDLEGIVAIGGGTLLTWRLCWRMRTESPELIMDHGVARVGGQRVESCNKLDRG